MSTGPASWSWICAQIGAREHYAIPRSLHHAGALQALITDFWASPSGHIRSALPQRLRDRFHPDLAAANVISSNVSTLLFEACSAVLDANAWDSMSRRNRRFQHVALNRLRGLAARKPKGPRQLFSYSYSARSLFQFAKTNGWKTVLGQIDPGPVEERLVARLHMAKPDFQGDWAPAPASYWDEWREECRLADRILVNSPWAREALISEGIAHSKIRDVPLAYDAPAQADAFTRTYPRRFTEDRPLRVLFLGQVNLRKGIGEIVDAMAALQSEPIDFCFVGPMQVRIPDEVARELRASWIGSVPRGEAGSYYRQSDVFLFPSHSDGFGITQLEAQAWKLPVIASRHCGEVVTDGVNGLVLESVSGSSITSALRRILLDPSLLQRMSDSSRISPKHAIAGLDARLAEAVAE